MRILLTGAGGFVGSHVLRHLLVNTDAQIICPVSFRHKGLPERLRLACQGNDPLQAHEFRHRVDVDMADLRAPVPQMLVDRWGEIDVIMNVASESHVDRSIEYPADFIRNNTDLMLNMLEYARAVKPRLFLQMSTDEVYGPAAPGTSHREWIDPLVPSNPYSASKAAQEAICVAYWRTYGVPVVLTNTMNIIGETQDPEKFMPLVMRRVLRGETVILHASKDGVPGSRFYLHARNLADAWLWLMTAYAAGGGPSLFADGHDRPDRWNIVGEREVDNLEFAQMIAARVGKELKYELVDFHSSRPGHDLRYALDGAKLRDAGWHAPFSLEESLDQTVRWTLDRPWWLGVS